MRHWRKMTWVLWGWTILCAIWLGTGIASVNTKDCGGLSQSACSAATHVGEGIGVFAIFIVWLLVFLVLSLIWFMTRPKRSCPRCGRNVKTGVTQCQGCGYDFAAPSQAS
jgi:hypothetical protein